MNTETAENLNEVGESILDAAGQLFEHYGYRKTTIEEIAQEAKIGKGTVYLHFKSKEDVGVCWLSRLHSHILGDLVGVAESDGPTTDRIREILTRRVMLRFDIFDRHKRSLDEALSSLKEVIQERKEAFHRNEAELIQTVIREGIANGEIEIDDPATTAESMILATNSLMPYSLRPAQLGNRECVLSKTQALAGLLVRAIQVKR